MISWGGKSNTVAVGDRGVVARAVASVAEGWVATIDLSSSVDLTIDAVAPSVTTVSAALWTRPADRGVGVAVLSDRDGAPQSLATIPLCDCGERGCGHAGRQLVTTATADYLVALINQLEPLDISGSLRDGERLWIPSDPTSLP